MVTSVALQRSPGDSKGDLGPERPAEMVHRVTRQSVLRKIRLRQFDQATATVMQRKGDGFYPDEEVLMAVVDAFHSGELSADYACNLLVEMLDIEMADSAASKAVIGRGGA